jgi:hypothetical protein
MLENLIVGILIVVIGLVMAFFGYGFWRFAITVSGFVAGYELGSGVAPGNWLLPSLFGVVVSLVAGVLAYFLWSVGIVVAGVISGAALGGGTLSAVGLGAGWTIVVGSLVGAVLGGLLAYLLKDVGVIAVMAFGGAAAVAHGVVLAMSFLRGGAVSMVVSGAIIGALGVLGFLTQYIVFRARFEDRLYFERPA